MPARGTVLASALTITESEPAMSQAPRLKFPPFLLFLDLLGTVLLMLGILEGFTSTSLMPDSLKFENHPYVLIGLGVALMAPLLIHIIRHITQTSNPSSPRKRGTDI